MQSNGWKDCLDIFNEALEHPAVERTAYLDRVCGGNTTLRRKVELLLDSHGESGDFIESPVFEVAPEFLAGDPDALIGQHLGSYRIDAVLGVGGMGVVYLAFDERLGRKVGLKLLPRSLVADAAQLERLKREARTASALNHPNIVTIHEIGEANGIHYIATEYIEGVTLREHIAKGPLPPNEAVEIATQLASALHVAHKAGIVHRDIKPENIMIRRDGYVKVLDFGIAKFVQPAALQPAATSTQGLILGTTRYMSPEQMRGQSVDLRTDIWSLGVVLYEMLVGEPPFTGDTNTDVIAAVLRSDAPLGRVGSGRLQRIVHRTLQKEPEARYQNAAELRADLQCASSKTYSLGDRTARVAAIAAVAIAALGGALWLWRTPIKAPSPAKQSIAVLPFQNLSPDPNNAYFAEGMQNEIVTRLSKIAALKVISRTSTQKYKSTPENTREIGRQLGVTHLVEGAVQRVGDSIKVNVQLIRADRDEHLWAESYSRSLDNIFAVEGEVASAIAQQLKVTLTGAEEEGMMRPPTRNPAAYEAYLRGVAIEESQTSSEAPLIQAAAAYNEAVNLDPNFALAWARLGVARSFLASGNVDPAANSPATAKAAVDKAMALDPELGESWLALGAYRYRVARDYPAALQPYEEARRRLPNNSLVLQQTAFLERRLGHWEKGLRHYREAMTLDPRNASVLTSSSGAFFTPMRRYADSQAALDRVLELVPGAEGTIANKAWVFHFAGRLKEAAEQLAKIPANSTEETVLTVRPRHFAYERRFEEAIVEMERLISYISKPGAPLGGEALSNLTLLGYYQEWAGRPEEARNTFRRVIETMKPTPDAVVPVTAKKLPCYLALAYAGLGDKENALAAARRAVEDYRDDAVDKPFAEQTLVQIQARFGDTEGALAALPHLLEVPSGAHKGLMRIDPLWDPLRGDPRFKKLCEEREP